MTLPAVPLAKQMVRLPQEMNKPPFIGRVVPVRYEARSDTRNTTA